jgi:uncharacterized membrane protein
MMGWGLDLASWLWMGAWILALLAMTWLIVRGSAGRAASDDAVSILRARFASGEISQEEFDRARRALDAEVNDRRREIP